MSKEHLSIKFEINVKAATALECIDGLLESVEEIAEKFLPHDYPLIEQNITSLREQIELPRSEPIDD